MAYPPAWAARYDITQAYDKNGNRTGYDKNTAAGFTSSYGRSENLGYTFNAVNAITQITDGDDAGYLATVTCDANGNITEVDEKMDVMNQINHLYTYFTYDSLNRLTEHKTKAYKAASSDWQWTKRVHAYDAVGRLTASTYKQWLNNGTEPDGSSLEHCYAGSRHIQNYDGSNYGAVWHWAGSAAVPGGGQAPLRSPNPDTAAQSGYNVAAAGAAGVPQRRTFLSPTTEGDKRELYAQGRPQAKDAAGSGANWYLGTKSERQVILQPDVESRLFFEGTVTATDMSRATDKREKDRVGIFGTGNSYAGSYGRVTSESLGRDLNPLGRGDGRANTGGRLDAGSIAPALAQTGGSPGGGNSVNDSGGGAGQAGGAGGSGYAAGCCGLGCTREIESYIRSMGSVEARLADCYSHAEGHCPNPCFGLEYAPQSFDCKPCIPCGQVDEAWCVKEGSPCANAAANGPVGPGGGVIPVPPKGGGCPGCGGGGGSWDVFGPGGGSGGGWRGGSGGGTWGPPGSVLPRNPNELWHLMDVNGSSIGPPPLPLEQRYSGKSAVEACCCECIDAGECTSTGVCKEIERLVREALHNFQAWNRFISFLGLVAVGVSLFVAPIVGFWIAVGMLGLAIATWFLNYGLDNFMLHNLGIEGGKCFTCLAGCVNAGIGNEMANVLLFGGLGTIGWYSKLINAIIGLGSDAGGYWSDTNPWDDWFRILSTGAMQL